MPELAIEDEIAERARRLLFKSCGLDYGTDQVYCYLQLGDYHLNWDNGYGLTINQTGPVHATIFRQGANYSSFEQSQPDYLPQLLRALQQALILDDLADV